jgi:hypothetical protein
MTYYDGFYSVHLVKSFATAGADNKLSSYLTIESGQIKEQAKSLPDWAVAFVDLIKLKETQKLSDEKKNKLDNEQDGGPKLGR